MAHEDIRARIATRLQDARKSKGYTLAQVGEMLGVSPSQLSRIENGNQDISVVEMMRFANLYDISVVDFFLEDDNDTVFLTRRKDRTRLVRNLTNQGPVVQELLTHVRSISMEPSLLFIPPLADSGESLVHQGEEFVTVLDGAVRFWIETRSEDLEYGDTLYYQCTRPHRWANLLNRPATLLVVSTPPSY